LLLVKKENFKVMHASYVSMILEDADNIWQFLKQSQSQSQCQEIKFLKQPTFFSPGGSP
jgi:hypothetical protein